MTQQLHLTYKQTVDGLREIVRKSGRDYIDGDYELGCVNFDDEDGQPSCIVGHLYAMHGIWDEGYWATDSVVELAARGVLTFDSDSTKDILANIQKMQDEWVSWGDALDRALKSAEEEKTE